METMLVICDLENGKRVFIEGNSFHRDEAHEIIILLAETWGTDFEKQELKDKALGIEK